MILLYAALYAITRFVVEFYRDNFRGDMFGISTLTGLSTSQLIAASIGLISLVLFFLRWQRSRSAAATASSVRSRRAARIDKMKSTDTTEALPPEIVTFEIEAPDVGTRLDVYLAARIGATSRARIQRLIEGGDVLVGEKAASKPSYKLRPGDHLEVELNETLVASELTPEDIPLDILYEDDDLIVVNKPAGMVVHPGAGVSTGTLAHALLFHFSQLPTRGGRTRPGIVHRLDRETSGAILVAKTETAHENLSDQFRARTVFKSYVALVHGRLKDEGVA
ncbi:MAG: pseudouridine synthase [Pyrinomonadaceae bacterium]